MDCTQLRKNLLIGFTTLLFAGAAFAADPPYVTLLSSGATVSSLETGLGDYLLSKSVQDFGYSIYLQGRTYGVGNQEYVSSTPEIDFVNKHKGGYCSTNITAEVQGAFACTQLNGVAQADAKYIELGDINFTTIIDPDTYTQLTDLAAQNLIRNIVNPFPSAKYRTNVTSPGFMEDGAKKEEYAKYMASQAILGVSLYSFNEMYGRRVPGSTFGASGAAASTSLMATMRAQSTQRYEQADFATYLAAPSTDQLAVLKEIAAMKAYKLWMGYQRYKQQERIEALLAAALAKLVNDANERAALITKISTMPTNMGQ